MEEDEDVLVTGADFHNHLKSAGFSDVETTPTHRPLQPDPPKEKPELIDSNIMEEMLVLRAANLLFEDDLDHVDSIFSNFEPNNSEPLKSMFRGSVAALVVAVGLGFYVFIGGIAFILVSAFYAYRTTDYLWRKYRRLKNLKRLMSAMQSNFSLVNRLIKFLHETENLVKNKLNSCQKAEAFLATMKSDYIKIQTEVNNVLCDATTKLLRNVPLAAYVDSPDTYVCQLMDEFRNCENVSQLYNIYMLLQSQFLTRLTFSLVPNLLTDPKKSDNHVEKTIASVGVYFEDLQVSLNSKLKFALMNGTTGEAKPYRSLPQKDRPNKPSPDVVIKNVHDLANSLQYCLLKARQLENNLEMGGENADTELDLATIDAELSSCRTHISDVIILSKKLQSKPSGPELSKRDDAEVLDADVVTLTELGFPDLDPKVDDDIFEAFIDGFENKDNSNAYDWAEEEIDPLAKKKQREMLGELKTRLKPQADEWARRENLVFARKGIAPLEVSSPEESRPETPLGEAMLASGLRPADLKQIIQEQATLDRGDEETFGDSGSDDDFSGMDPSIMAEFFLRNLGGPMQEQSYCFSGDESD